jgi:CheY-like chemotaxis protein
MTEKAIIATRDRPSHILVAEDSAGDMSTVGIALGEQNPNHILHVATDGEEAIAFVNKADADLEAPGPDLLPLDMHLPRYSGEQILQRLRSAERYAQTLDHAQKHAALFYFRRPSRLEEFIQLSVIVRDILTSCTGPARPSQMPETLEGSAQAGSVVASSLEAQGRGAHPPWIRNCSQKDSSGCGSLA